MVYTLFSSELRRTVSGTPPRAPRLKVRAGSNHVKWWAHSCRMDYGIFRYTYVSVCLACLWSHIARYWLHGVSSQEVSLLCWLWPRLVINSSCLPRFLWSRIGFSPSYSRTLVHFHRRWRLRRRLPSVNLCLLTHAPSASCTMGVMFSTSAAKYRKKNARQARGPNPEFFQFHSLTWQRLSRQEGGGGTV